jgi:hypothetical protein
MPTGTTGGVNMRSSGAGEEYLVRVRARARARDRVRDRDRDRVRARARARDRDMVRRWRGAPSARP